MNYLLLLFIVTPIIEMWVLIKVGGIIGALPTIGLVMLTAVIGLALLRQQGFATLFRARKKMQEGQLPAKEIVEGFLLAIGGALLLTPGFVTDVIGFACLIPGIRHLLIIWGMRHWRSGMQNVQGEWHTRHESTARDHHTTIEGDYRREDKKE